MNINISRIAGLPPKVLFSIDAALICAAVIAAPLVQADLTHFFNEGRFVTWWSAAQLLLIVRICWCTSRRCVQAADRRFWVYCAAAFVFLAADELALIHEKIDHGIHLIFSLTETALTDRIDDVLVLLYGIVFLLFLGAHRTILYPLIFERLSGRKSGLSLGLCPQVYWVLASGGLFCVMVLLDILTSVESESLLFKWLEVGEDSAKLFSETCLVAAAQASAHTVQSLQPRMQTGSASVITESFDGEGAARKIGGLQL